MDDILANIERHRDQFYRFVVRNVWDHAMVDDVFASAVLAAFENRDKFTPGTNFRAWMFKILMNKCFSANREKLRAFEPLNEEMAVLDPGAVDVIKDPQDFMERCGDEVHHAFRRLSTAQRACIWLKDVEKFSYQEIAETLDIPAGTVMTHLARGRALLRKHLLEYARKQGIIRTLPKVTSRPEGDAQRAQRSAVF